MDLDKNRIVREGIRRHKVNYIILIILKSI